MTFIPWLYIMAANCCFIVEVRIPIRQLIILPRTSANHLQRCQDECRIKGLRGYKDGLQPEILADGNWLVKQNQPVSKIETKSDTNLRSLYESYFRNALISKSVIRTVMTSQERNKFRAQRSKRTQNLEHSFKKVSVSHAQLAHFSTLAKEKHIVTPNRWQ